MGSGGSKKSQNNQGNLNPENFNRERRPSHIDTNPPPKSDVLVECKFCGRTFASDRIDRHIGVGNLRGPGAGPDLKGAGY